MEDYCCVKGLLFVQLGNVYNYDCFKFVVFNVDDVVIEEYIKNMVVIVIIYGIDCESDICVINI